MGNIITSKLQRSMDQAKATKYLYKIRDKKTGLYSTGGMYPGWGTKGKTWNSIGSLKCHLRQFCDYKKSSSGTNWHLHENKIPKDWEVIKIKYIETEVEHISAFDLYPEEFE